MRSMSAITWSGLVLSMVLVVAMGCGGGIGGGGGGGSGGGGDPVDGGGSDNDGDSGDGGDSGDDGGTGSPMFDRWRTPSFFRGFDIGYFNYGSGTKSVDDFLALKATGANLAQIQSNEGTVDWAPPYAINQDGSIILPHSDDSEAAHILIG